MPPSDQPRATASLDGIWQARLDPNDVGLAEAWADPDMPFDRELPVPLPWQAADPALRRYAGVVWYRRMFEIPPAWRDRSLALRFGAVDYGATVWVNGLKVGGHEGGYTPFVVELGDRAARSGPNSLTVRVVDPAELDELPHGKQGGRWYTPVSGLWQSVALISRPAERVDRLRCYPDALRGLVRVAATCRVGAGATRLLVEVLESGGERPVAGATALVSDETPTALVELRIPEPRLWEPDTPHLYILRATLRAPGGETLDVFEERFGLRMGEGSAAAWVLFVIILIFSLIQFKFFSGHTEY
jgi:beta-galactosidase/beta-glucuronidase